MLIILGFPGTQYARARGLTFLSPRLHPASVPQGENQHTFTAQERAPGGSPGPLRPIQTIADSANLEVGASMKIRASVRRICENCKIVRRQGKVLVVCSNPRHKQRQG